MKYTTAIRLDAGNDTNGNPRRVWLAFQGDEIVQAWDTGYAGKPKELKDHNPATLATTPREYRELVKQFGRPEPITGALNRLRVDNPRKAKLLASRSKHWTASM